MYLITLVWIYPKGIIKDKWGKVTQAPDPLPHSIIEFIKAKNDEIAIEHGRYLWKHNFIGKRKRLVVSKCEKIGLSYYTEVFKYEG